MRPNPPQHTNQNLNHIQKQQKVPNVRPQQPVYVYSVPGNSVPMQYLANGMIYNHFPMNGQTQQPRFIAYPPNPANVFPGRPRMHPGARIFQRLPRTVIQRPDKKIAVRPPQKSEDKNSLAAEMKRNIQQKTNQNENNTAPKETKKNELQKAFFQKVLALKQKKSSETESAPSKKPETNLQQDNLKKASEQVDKVQTSENAKSDPVSVKPPAPITKPAPSETTPEQKVNHSEVFKQVNEVKQEKKKTETKKPEYTIKFRIEDGRRIYQVKDLLLVKEMFKKKPEQLNKLNLNMIVSKERQRHKPVMRPTNRPRWNASKQVDKVQSTVAEKPKLNTSENAWNPHAQKDKTAAVLSKARSMLNKLSPETFDTLTNQFKNHLLSLESLTDLENVVKLVQEKALLEPNFSDMYADLCFHIERQTESTKSTRSSKKKVFSWKFLEIYERSDSRFFWSKKVFPKSVSKDSVEPDSEYASEFYSDREKCEKNAASTDFKKIILLLCQKDFEKHSKPDNTAEEIKALKEKLLVTKEDSERTKIRTELENLNYKFDKLRKKKFGNVIFIGELYKKKLLRTRVLTHIISSLLSIDTRQDLIPWENPDSENIECLCKLLNTLGEVMREIEKDHAFYKLLLGRLKELSTHKKLQNRFKFMVKDVLEMKNNGWKPLRKKEKAKKLEDVKKDMIREEEQKAREARRTNKYNSNSMKSSWQSRTGGSSMNVASGRNMTRSHSAASNAPKLSIYGSKPKLNKTSVLGRSATVASSRVSSKAIARAEDSLSVEEKTKIQKTVKSTVSEYETVKEADDVVYYFEKFNENTPTLKVEKRKVVKRYALESTIRYCLEGPVKYHEVIPKIISILKNANYFDSDDLSLSLKMVFSQLADIVIDSPRATEYLGSLCAHLVGQSLITLRELKSYKPGLTEKQSKKACETLFSELDKLKAKQTESLADIKKAWTK